MKKLHVLLICFSLCMISCKKENVTLFENEDNSKVSYLKNWYETHRNHDTRQFSRDEFTLYPQNILWETGIHLPESNRYVFSLSEYQDEEISIPKLIIFYLSEDGEVTNSEYVFLRANENTTGMTLPEIMAAYVDAFEDEDIPETLVLSMLKFNMDGERIFSKHIENGEITDTDEQIKSVEKAPLEAGLEYCIDSWWVMYLEGQVIYIYYLGSECFCVGCNQNGGGGGNGGGSSGNSQCNYTPEQAQSILNDVTITNPDKVTTVLGSSNTIGGIERQPKNTQFDFANIHLYLSPYRDLQYSAKFSGIRYRNTAPTPSQWKWESFNYDQTVMTDGIIPTCSDVTMAATVTPMVWNDQSRATVQVSYTAIIKISCGSSQVDRPINGIETTVIFP